MSEKLSERKWEYEIFPKSIAQELFNFYFEGINGAGFVGKDYESLCNKVEALEAEVKRLSGELKKTQSYHERSRIVVAESRLSKAQELIAREWDSPTYIQDSEKIEEYEHCTCAEDYAIAFVKRLKKALGGDVVGV